MGLFKRSTSVMASPALALFAVALLICMASRSQSSASPPGVLTKAWRGFWSLHFGWRLAIILWLTVMIGKVLSG